MRVRDAVRYAAWLKGLSSAHASERAEQCLREVDLADRGSARCRELSGGMEQRLGLAAALAADPPGLILDEPSALIAVGLTPLFAATAGLSLHGASFGLPRPAVPLAVVGWCLAGCALGLALGRRFPSIAIAPAAGVAVYVFLVVPIYFPSLAFIGRLTPFGSTSSAYAGPTPMYSLLQCGAGIAVAAWLWPRSSSRRATTLWTALEG